MGIKIIKQRDADRSYIHELETGYAALNEGLNKIEANQVALIDQNKNLAEMLLNTQDEILQRAEILGLSQKTQATIETQLNAEQSKQEELNSKLKGLAQTITLLRLNINEISKHKIDLEEIKKEQSTKQ